MLVCASVELAARSVLRSTCDDGEEVGVENVLFLGGFL